MIRKFLSGGAILIALAAPASAQEQCAVPAPPSIPDGTKAAANQIVSAQNEIKAYAAASDAYQACIVAEIARQKDLAKQSNAEFDSTIETTLTAQSGAQRKDVERVAGEWNATLQAFNAALQRKQRQPGNGSPLGGSGGYGGGGGGYGGGGRY